jgi:hypothetical protein
MILQKIYDYSLFFGRATCENPTFAACNARVPSRHDYATKYRNSAVVDLPFEGVCVTLRAHGGFEWKHSRSQQLNACATIHGAL